MKMEQISQTYLKIEQIFAKLLKFIEVIQK